MGTCFGQLSISKKKSKRFYQLKHSHYSKNEDRVELHFLVEDEDMQNEESNNEEIPKSKGVFSRIISFFKPNSYQHIGGGHGQNGLLEIVSSERVEESWAPQNGSNPQVVNFETESQTEAEEVQLVTLDVRSLRNVQPSWRNLTPPSSVDLEWENDSVVENIPAVCRRRLLSMTEDCSTGSMIEGSPVESLEWDSCDHLALDTDTEQLLCEIERLTARALRETGGDWANR